MSRMTVPTRTIAPAAVALTMTLALAGCVRGPAPAAVQPVAPPTPIVPVVTPVSSVAGLQQKEPDTCGAAKFASAVGQTQAVIPTLGVTRKYRIAEYRGIEPQEYDPLRMVFRLDQAGVITAVSCG